MVTQDVLNDVAAEFGVKQGQRLRAWVFAFAGLRNLSAHGARVWNRRMKRNLKIISAAVDERLFHLAADKVAPADLRPSKLYQVAAALGYALQSLDPDSDWPRRFAELIESFPPVGIELDPLNSMGFPESWRSEPLWS